MNPNIYNQAIYPFNFYIPPINSLQNPTTEDFERLIDDINNIFSLLYINKDITQELQLRTFLQKLILTL